MTTITIEEVNSIIHQYGPVFQIHPQEKFLPDAPIPFLATGACSLNWGLISAEDDYDAFNEKDLGSANVSSGESLAAAVVQAKADPNAKSTSFRYWLNIADSLELGDLQRASAQVCVQRGVNDDVINIQFWLFYGYNGPGKAHITFGAIIDEIVFFKESGSHYGDWEHVTLVVGRDASAPGGWKITKVYLSRHDLTIWVQDPSTLSYQGLHPIIYVARDSHAHYESAGQHNYKRVAHKDYVVGHLDVDLFDLTADQGPQFDASIAGHFDIVFSAYDEHHITPPVWWNFDARWGQYTKELDTVNVPIPIYGDYSYTYKSVESGPKGPAGHVPSGLSSEWTGAMGQGSGAVAWLVGDFNGDGKAEIVQAWGDELNFIMYGSDGYGGLKTLWTGSMGQGSGAVTWLVGDFNGDGKSEIIQGWGDDLNFIMYGSDGAGGLKTLWTGAMGEGSGAVTWLVGDFNGDGKSEIVQGWGDDLNFIMYGSDGAGGLKTHWTGAMGQGSGAVKWLVGDFDGDGQAEIIQAWGADLNFIVYDSDGAGGLATQWTGAMGQGSGAATWLVGDFNGDGNAEIAQGWGDDLNFIVYGNDGANAMKTLWTGAMGQGSGAVTWLVGDFNGDGKSEIIQGWGDDLNFIMYGSDGAGGLQTLWTGAMGQGAGAVTWLVGDFNGDGKSEIVQGWGDDLNFIMYSKTTE
ncbi:DUF946 domain-containing protein [Candidatus Methylospira mobilis]|uniref:DUF946 domain-containing protein n=1 Tax=Candidatus Methylospira mobilis TaxID=1808979 RepID=A0A5Q0BJY6_9GAMM|nr:Vps62-related protein [Candidatus Methylospira mobilis]QFY42468.1 DUF946 domain-containing protein [Candidatus Methylospira mobilis]WNV04426.1 Vps62-related protein [Candidatus Methylospira mobilis]